LSKPAKRMLFLDRFWSNVLIADDPWDCFEWQGDIKKNGYGDMRCSSSNGKKKHLLAHRVSFELWHKREITPGLVIAHLCDNRRCVNPCHLIEWTHEQNLADMTAKGRRVTRCNPRLGSQCSYSLLNEDQVRDIRRAPRYRGVVMALARQYSVSQPTISLILQNKTWRHVAP
jgi:hypothetical protein